MLTPSLACANNTYDIYNTTRNVLRNQSLTLLNDSIYYFTFNQTSIDGYIIRLCDNSTREITVTGGVENSSMLATSLIFIFLAAMTAIALFLVKETWMKAILGVILNLLIAALMYFSNQFFTINNPTATGLLDTTLAFYRIAVVALPINIALTFFYVLYSLVIVGFKQKMPGFKDPKEGRRF